MEVVSSSYLRVVVVTPSECDLISNLPASTLSILPPQNTFTYLRSGPSENLGESQTYRSGPGEYGQQLSCRLVFVMDGDFYPDTL
jgi:hypothetical protein